MKSSVTALSSTPPTASAQVQQPIGYKTCEIGTRAGKRTFEVNPATEKTAGNLFDELDFQRARQAYLWPLPIVNISERQRTREQEFGAGEPNVCPLARDWPHESISK
jgi:hypothetical protein